MSNPNAAAERLAAETNAERSDTSQDSHVENFQNLLLWQAGFWYLDIVWDFVAIALCIFGLGFARDKNDSSRYRNGWG
jgi:hypothetical protein